MSLWFFFIMKNILLLILLFSNFTFSQEISSENYFWTFNNNSNVEGVIGVKKCYVRKEPKTNSDLLDSLLVGNKITITSNSSESTVINGLNLSWVEIEYIKNNQIKKGFIWKGFIALGSSKKRIFFF